MSTLPNVVITQTNGNLGAVAPALDGTAALIATGVAVGGKFALGDILGPFKSVSDAEDMGITEAYDTTNKCMVRHHINEFYEAAGNGVDLYVMVVAKTVTMTQMCDKTLTHAAKLLANLAGKVKLIAITRIPDVDYAPTYEDQFEVDLFTAIAKALELNEYEQGKKRYAHFIFEGRNWQGNASSSQNLRSSADGPNMNRASVVMFQKPETAALETEYAKYASAAYVMGLYAANPVQRSIGRVKSGAISFTEVGYSNNAAYSTIDETKRETLNSYGYIFATQHVSKAGFFINDDHCACPVTDDYAYVTRGRVMDKVSRITDVVYTEELLDDISLDETSGRLAVSTCKAFQQAIENEVNRQMTVNQELTSIDVYVNPEQNVLSTNEIKAEINVLPKGTARKISATLSFINPVAN